MSFVLYDEAADAFLAREAAKTAKNPTRKPVPMTCFIEDVRRGDYARAGKRLMKSPTFRATMQPGGKLVLMAQSGVGIGHLQVSPVEFAGRHGYRGWAVELGRRLMNASATQSEVPMHAKVRPLWA